jgi:hypothetical protein
MQSTILPPPKPLGVKDATTELHSEVSNIARNNNLLPVAPSSMLTLIQLSTSTNNNNKRHAWRRVSSKNSNNYGSRAAHSFGDIFSLVEVMNQKTKAILR